MLLLVVISAGLAIRALFLNEQSLWFDEMAQAAVAQTSWKDMFPLITRHSSPPLDYVLMKLVMLLLGTADWVVRMPALVFGVASIYALYRFACSLTDRKDGLLAAALLALSPMAIAYSQEARMYSLFLFLSLVSYLLARRFIERHDLASGVWLGIANGLLLLSHYFGVFVIAGEGMILLGVMRSKEGWNRRAGLMAVTMLIPLVMFLPWLPYFITQLEYTGGEVGYALRADALFFKSIISSFAPAAGGHRGWLYAYLLLFAAGAAYAWRNRERQVLTVVACFAGMLCLLFGITYVARVVTARNAIFLLPIFLLVCARGVRAISIYSKIPPGAAVLMMVLVLAWPAWQAARGSGKVDWRDAAAYIRERATPEEKIITSDFISRACLAYYLDPGADYVIMRARWRDTANDPGWKIWVMDDRLLREIQEKRFSGWAVIPPSALLAVTEGQLDAYNALLGRPVRQYPVFPRSLNIYRLPASLP
jgi:4-amino-4-deoxy-L-arabinose transferase-like glycosyltransferase